MIDKLNLDRVVDGLLDAYVDWRIACDCVDDAYRAWAVEIGSVDRAAFERYVEALDVEECAAEGYAALARLAYKRLWGEGTSAEASARRAQEIGRT